MAEREPPKCPRCNDEGLFIFEGGIFLCLEPIHAQKTPEPEKHDLSGATHDR